MEEYDEDREAVIARAAEKGLEYMLTVATEEGHFHRAIGIIEKNPAVYGAIGIHPHNAKDYSQELQKRIIQLAKHPKVVAYGEIGLDFFKDYSPRQAQIEVFSAQVSAAKEAGLPLIIHSRDAKEETLGILKDANLGDIPVVIHCFSYDLATAKTMLDLGFHLSITGVVTYKNSPLPEIVRSLPLESLLAETDSPYLTPIPHRGKRNEPAHVVGVYEKIGDLQKRSVDEVSRTINKTFRTLFLGGVE